MVTNVTAPGVTHVQKYCKVVQNWCKPVQIGATHAEPKVLQCYRCPDRAGAQTALGL